MRDKEKLYSELMEVLEEGVSLASVARETEIKYSTLHQFKERHYLGDENSKKLQRYLDKRSALPQPIPPDQARDVLDQLGILVYNVSTVLRSPDYDPVVRLDYLDSQWEAIQHLSAGIRARLEREGDTQT